MKNNRAHTIMYAVLFLVFLDALYFIPNLDHYLYGGLQGIVLLVIIIVIALVVDLILLTPAYYLVKHIINGKHKLPLRIAVGTICCLLVAFSIYTATKPLPYVQEQIDSLQEAHEYFIQNREALQTRADSGETVIIYYLNPPIVYVSFVFEPDYELAKSGKVSRAHYIEIINDDWYIDIIQSYAP